MGFFFNSRRTNIGAPTGASGVSTDDTPGARAFKEWAENNIRVPRDVRDREPSLPGGEGPGFLAEEFRVEIAADDQSTLVEIYEPTGGDDPLGSGVARRRKGDRRNTDLGVALAMARAFRDASDRYARVAEELLR